MTAPTTPTTRPPGRGEGAAGLLEPVLREVFAGPPPFALHLWDGSTTGPADGPRVRVRHRRALRRLLWQPGELGLADAWISGELDVDGDLGEALSAVRRALAGRVPARPAPRSWPALLSAAARLGAVGPPPPRPGGRAKVSGALHSRSRDRAVISHHYDLSNEFYALLLGPAMAYSCAYYTQDDQTLQDAQEAKFDLICRKLDLRPGTRLLDVGCGWGALARHAALHHGARVTAVTLSARQHAHARALVAEAGVADLVDVRLCDYREIPADAYDAVSCVEMGEHVGRDEYPAFAARLHGLLRPGGRLLVQQMSRGATAPGGGAFIEAYITPDMHMRPLGQTVDLIEAAGLEVLHTEAMRPHYARTIDAWRAELTRRQDRFTALVGRPTVRLWQLYLAGSSLAFAEGRMGVDQILARRPGGARETVRPAAWCGS
ncbi:MULTISPECIES: class I SAM-dependent methyltransferase [Kitasatospora]|uniref:Putative cyclopropane-fatty-acyl-phospholipid synthase n=1 Tax=Kitasatospora setae (strain ATCC 33774 / DSM 43861 / JCM 3304 / KCC A-0304 / NBRC 14216 / KM-6054) TaxID=452652 RepID=E4NJP0_KITSK|nr:MULTISPECIES: class I SAM-dependent methyltransferase [Kitasatospora]BAJ33188.1 putative cyclopropane-fatty-acyl-phospholipid synthase [Kitasatospora setae KM-6054]